MKKDNLGPPVALKNIIGNFNGRTRSGLHLCVIYPPLDDYKMARIREPDNYEDGFQIVTVLGVLNDINAYLERNIPKDQVPLSIRELGERNRTYVPYIVFSHTPNSPSLRKVVVVGQVFSHPDGFIGNFHDGRFQAVVPFFHPEPEEGYISVTIFPTDAPIFMNSGDHNR